MSAVIVGPNGKIVVASPNFSLRPRSLYAQAINPRVPTAEEQAEIDRRASIYVDPRSGIAYEMKDRLDPKEWVTADTLMRWYSASFTQVVAWVNHGRIAAAMERGSPTKRYRVRDPKYLLEDKVRRLAARPKRG